MSNPNLSGVWTEDCLMRDEPMDDKYDNDGCEASEDRNDMAENEPTNHFEEFVDEVLIAPTGSPDQQFIPNFEQLLEPQPADDLDQLKIQFAAGLSLMPKNATTISSEPLSKMELSYIAKCEAMVDMHRTFVCACHNVSYRNLTGILSHLRPLRIWFPLLTCLNCMVTFSNRSTYARHMERCSYQSLHTIIRLSNMRKRTDAKTRIYQNFRCTICKFLFSFHEDIRRHVRDKHSPVRFPFHCRCNEIFNNIEDYEDHVFTSCLVNFYCDICSATTETLDDFQRHARNVHDNSEGFIMLQDDDYNNMENQLIHGKDKDVANGSILTEKGEERASSKSKNTKCPICPKEYSTHTNMLRHYKVHTMRKSLHEEKVDGKGKAGGIVKTDNVAYKNTVSIMNPISSSKFKTRKCPICSKEFFNYNNMMRHHKVHLEKQKVAKAEEEESLYSCPDCGGMYRNTEWQNHVAENHDWLNCGECDQSFQFQTELERHKGIHLNLKVYRDPNTKTYKSIAISSGYESNLSHGNDLLDASAEVSTNTDDKIRKYQLRNEEFASNSGLSDPKRKCHFDRTPLSSSCPMPYEHHESGNHKNDEMNPAAKHFSCSVCAKNFQTASALASHLGWHRRGEQDSSAKLIRQNKVTAKLNQSAQIKQTSMDEPIFRCLTCFAELPNDTALQVHILENHRIIGDIRLISRKIDFSTQDEDDTHQRSHDFLQRERQQEHVPMVEGDIIVAEPKPDNSKSPMVAKKFPCKYCSTGFSRSNTLGAHVRRKHKEHVQTEFKCTQCDRIFYKQGSLAVHFKVHGKQRAVIGSATKSTLSCSVCNMIFDLPKQLLAHVMIAHPF